MGAEPVRFRPHIVRRVVATGLSSPTDLAVSADADLIYTERRQGVVVKRASGASAVVWAPTPPAWSTAVTLGSVALDPDFSATRVLYVLLLEPSPGRAKVDLVRLQLKDDLSGVVGQRVVLTTTHAVGDPIPLGESPQMGGKVRVGPDGFLYIGLGDFGSGASPRSPLSLAGTVLRIAANGQPAPGNKPAAGADPRVFALGVQRPVGIAFQPNTEDLVLAHQRPSMRSGLAVIRAGADSGWPAGCPADQPGGCEGAGLTRIHWREVVAWRAADRGGAAGIERLRGHHWREWKNALAVSFDGGGGIEFVQVDAGGQVTRSVQLLTGLEAGFGSIADGPDGLYALVKRPGGRQEIWRLTNG